MSPETEPKPRREDGYERQDASVRTLLQFAFWLAVLIAVVLVVMRWTFNFLSVREPTGPPPTPFENARTLPPQPRLQAEPHQDLKTYCDGQLARLNSYGWTDQQNGVTHIPIDQAMDKLLQQGLPIRPQSGAGDPAGETAPVARVGTVEAPLPTGIGGPCSFVAERPSFIAERPPAGSEK
jgi:hypothetical protein